MSNAKLSNVDFIVTVEAYSLIARGATIESRREEKVPH